MNPETLKAMKEVTETALRTPMWRMSSQVALDLERYVNPANVSALIADYERVLEENERLKPTSPRCLTCGTVIANHCTKCIRDWES